MFYVDELRTPCWKVIIHKEARSKLIIIEKNEKISTPIDNVIGIEVPLIIPKVLSNTTLVGAIELIGIEAILTVVGLQRPFDDYEDTMGWPPFLFQFNKSIDSPPNSLMDSTANPKVKTIEGKGVGARSLACSTSRVKGRVRAPRWGLGRMTSKSINHTSLQNPNNKLVSA
jgi:hypothetical protein